MATMILGLLVFFAVHSLPMQPDLRNGLVDRFGAGTFKAAFAIISLIGFALIVVGYGKLQVLPGKNPQIWQPPAWMSHITLALMLVSMVLLVAAYVPSNIKRIVGHPMLAAVKIWAFAHLLANGDLASMILFGSFLVYAVVDRISMKRREVAPTAGGGLAGDAAVLVGGVALYALFAFYAHEWLIGVAPLPGIGA